MVLAVVNETRPVDHALVQRLQKEIITLKGLLKVMREHLPPDFLRNHQRRLQSGGSDVSDTGNIIEVRMYVHVHIYIYIYIYK